ncbi:hypothetical protein EVAR_90569_1 [Eumeta japonica]|uniref:Uncharacterized protein n=1 Tax=Eumeta variegata TaxID=151549 RepID=A0A4C1YU65_EUMVA|nr:hypothetical protein EVAR_90569_1 [Eumeta japonica]
MRVQTAATACSGYLRRTICPKKCVANFFTFGQTGRSYCLRRGRAAVAGFHVFYPGNLLPGNFIPVRIFANSSRRIYNAVSRPTINVRRAQRRLAVFTSMASP